MKENKITDQIGAIFGIFMTLFYISVGLYFIISPIFAKYDKALLNIAGGMFIFYGIYRGIRSFAKIREIFFIKNDNKRDFNRRSGI